MTDFIVLRDENAPRQVQSGSIAPGSFGVDAAVGRIETRPPEPRIVVEDMSKAQALDMRRDPSVRAIARRMPIRLITPVGTSTAHETETTWGVAAVGADRSPADGAGVRIAVLDTGIDPAHPAFAGVTLERRNFTGGPDDAADGQGHGTHCAGTIFGRDVDGLRIGVAPGVKEAMIGKVLDDSGGGSSEMLFEGMKWAQAGGARVISMSLGFDFPGLVEKLVADGWPPALAGSTALEAYRGNLRAFDAIMDMFRAMAAFDGGTVVVAAAVNESERQIDPSFEVSASLPAAAFDVISVGALARGEGGLTVADFSNTNPVLSAPGVDVISAKVGGGTVAFNGTSMACPHVAGVAALWWQALSRRAIPLTNGGVVARLRSATDASVFRPDVDVADRGDGLVRAPSAGMS